MENNPWLRALIVLLVFIAAIHLGAIVWGVAQQFADVLGLFFFAWLVAFALKPVARFFVARLRASWPVAVGIVYLLLGVALFEAAFVLVPALVSQTAQLAEALPDLVEALPDWTLWLQDQLAARRIHVNPEALAALTDLSRQAELITAALLERSVALVTSLVSAIVAVVLVLVLSFYIMLDGTRIKGGALALVPPAYRADALFFLDSIDRSFGGFLRGSLLQALVHGLGTAVIMAFAGLNYVVAGSVFAGLIMLIPFVGAVLAIVVPLLIALLQYGQLGAGGLLAVSLALFALQQFTLNVLTPRVMSQSVGVHPLLVFLAMLVGAKVAGVTGAIFGIPVVGVLSAMVRFVFHTRDLSVGGENPATADARMPSAMSRTARSILSRWWRYPA